LELCQETERQDKQLPTQEKQALDESIGHESCFALSA